MRLRPSRRSRTTRASFRILRCFEIAGRLTSKCSASSLTPCGRPSRYSRTARRVGSATARNGSAEYVTIWLRIMHSPARPRQAPQPGRTRNLHPRNHRRRSGGYALHAMLLQDPPVVPTPPTVTPQPTAPVAAPPKIQIAGMNFYYGPRRALENITLNVQPHQVTAFIGPSGCGKSTLLRSLNRMNDIIPGTRVEGSVQIDGFDIYAPSIDVVDLRRRVGMVFQKSNPFPKSIFDNVAYGLRINKLTTSREELRGRVEASLQAAALWEEVKD